MEKIISHKYQSGKLSIMDRIVSNQCNKIVEYLPDNMAPNLITTIGVFIQLQTSICYYLALRFNGEVPSFLFFYSGICTFIYQIMDILDGKQARRLKKSTPLGQLFDHGLDTIASSSITYNIIVAMNAVNRPIYCLYAIFILMNTFYLA